jgi:hypothetical protein
MNFSEDEIEKQLRAAPQPQTPAGLKQKLTAQINLCAAHVQTTTTVANAGVIGWLRRWWPALAPAGVSLACAAVMISQQMEARELRRGNQALEQQIAEANASIASATQAAKAASDLATAAEAEQAEMARLKERAAQLNSSVTRLEKLQVENETLRKQPVTPAGLSEEELAALAKAREKALSINCVNNLKQVGLAARLWAMDNKDTYPSSFLSMSNELNTPKILVCPADTNRVVARTFADYSDANCSYELLAPAGSDQEPQRVLTRCPIHGHIGLCDGSVQGEVAKKHPEWLVERDGKLYLHSN